MWTNAMSLENWRKVNLEICCQFAFYGKRSRRRIQSTLSDLYLFVVCFTLLVIFFGPFSLTVLRVFAPLYRLLELSFFFSCCWGRWCACMTFWTAVSFSATFFLHIPVIILHSFVAHMREVSLKLLLLFFFAHVFSLLPFQLANNWPKSNFMVW